MRPGPSPEPLRARMTPEGRRSLGASGSDAGAESMERAVAEK
jgi:hypothetical protein